MIWTWEPVTLDCHEAPLTAAVEYLVRQSQKAPAGFITVCDPDCRDEIVYGPLVPLSEDVSLNEMYEDSLVFVPPLGGVTYIDVEARADGRVSDEACP